MGAGAAAGLVAEVLAGGCAAPEVEPGLHSAGGPVATYGVPTKDTRSCGSQC